MATTKMDCPENFGEANVRGIVLKPDKNRQIDVPDDLVVEMLSHGLTVAKKEKDVHLEDLPRHTHSDPAYNFPGEPVQRVGGEVNENMGTSRFVPEDHETFPQKAEKAGQVMPKGEDVEEEVEEEDPDQPGKKVKKKIRVPSSKK